MDALNRLRVGPRLLLGFGIVLAIMLVMILVGLARMAMIQENLDQIVRQDYAKITLLNTMRDAVRFRGIALRDVVLQEDIAFKRGELKRIKEVRKTYQEADASLGKLVTDPAEQALLEGVRKAETLSSDKITQVVDATLSEDTATAQSLIRDEVRPSQIELIKQLDAMLGKLEKNSQDKSEAAHAAYQSARLSLIALGLAALVLGGLIALAITRSLTRPLNDAVNLARRIAQGDLTGQVDSKGGDELAHLLAALNGMNQSLSGLIGEVAGTARHLAQASESLSGTVRETSVQADSQTEQVMQVSASTEQMSVSIAEVASSAESVAQAANRTRDMAQDGNRNMGASAETMQRIVASVAESSAAITALSSQIEQISQVTQVIRDIADQTNLLALNAAIEAARAGEQGRGFAVVADEVRKLAERTASSTLSIRETVDAVAARTQAVVATMAKVSSEVDENARISATTREMLGNIASAASAVDDLVGHIADATREQTRASHATTGAIERISQIFEQNSNRLHEMETSAQSLDQAANALETMVGRFNLR